VGSYSIATYLLDREKLRIPHIAVLSDKRMTTGLSIATAPELRVLRDILQKAMYSVSDRELNALSKKWLGESPQNPDWLYREKRKLEPYPTKYSGFWSPNSTWSSVMCLRTAG